MRLRPVPKVLSALCALVVFSASLLLVHAAQAGVKKSPGLKDEMRMPWVRNNERYIRHWLVVGAFPAAPGGSGLNTDYLADQGGETGVKPADGLKHRRTDGSEIKWHPMDSWGDVVGLADSVDGPKEHAVAYAFAQVSRKQDGKALLSVGSDEGIRVWVNGKLVLDKEADRSLTPDEEQIEVDLKSGDNAILLKAAQGVGPWTFSARVLEPGANLAPRVEINPSIVNGATGRLEVKTDAGQPNRDRDAVLVELVGPGGKVFFSKSAARGTMVGIDPAPLPDGPYEIRCTTHTLTGRLFTTHLSWYKGDSLAAATRLIAAAATADAATPEGFTVKMLADMVEDRLGGKPEKVTGNPWWKIHSPLMEFEEIKLEAKGQRARVRPHGFMRLAYRDEVDGSPQFCRAYLPAAYDPAKKWPLVLQIHGYNPANPVYVRWWAADSRHAGIATEFSNHQQVIYMEPHGRGNTSYLGLGDNDILRVIQLAKERFAVDDDRIYLTGDSMGGWGTWNVGTRHPDLFAAIAPVYGGSDYHSQLSEEELAALSPFERFRNEKQSSFALADGLLNMPIFVHHGDVDRSVNVEYSRWAVRLLSRWGYNIRYREIPGRGHEALDVMNDVIEWFLQHRRNLNPAHVRVRSADLRYASAYWAKVEQAANPFAFTVVDAEVVGPNLVRLDTENVLDIVLSPAASLIDARKPVQVVWNGVPQTLQLKDGRLRLRAEGYVPAGLHKSPQLPGSMGDFTGTPFAVVIGTVSKDPDMAQICREKADRFIGYWRQWQNQMPRVFKDTELAPADAARYSLLLFGGPAENAVAAQLADRLPLKISADEVRIGEKSFKAKDAAVQLIHPNPLNPERYVLVVAGTSADGMYFADPNNRDLADCDFAIVDGHLASPKQAGAREKVRVLSGAFDSNWQVRDDLLLPGDDQARSESRAIRRPKANGSIDPKTFDAYVGRYQIMGGPVITVSKEGNRLMAQAQGNPQVELIPESQTDFFIREANVRLSFKKDSNGKVSSLTGDDSGQGFMASRIE